MKLPEFREKVLERLSSIETNIERNKKSVWRLECGICAFLISILLLSIAAFIKFKSNGG